MVDFTINGLLNCIDIIFLGLDLIKLGTFIKYMALSYHKDNTY